MPAVPPALEAVHYIGQAGAAFCQVRGVDLRDVAQADYFSAWPGTGNKRFHLFRRKVLCLVDDQEFVQKGSPAHEVHGLHLDAGADQGEVDRKSTRLNSSHSSISSAV